LQCSSCWKLEETGSTSRRHASINWFDNNHLTSDTTNELVSLDWNSENVCNLACISCGPKFSSRWRQEILNYSFNDLSSENYINNLKDNKFWKLLDLHNLKRLYFNGGEPLLSLDHKEILAYLKEIGQLSEIELAYNTNGTIIPDNEVLDYWKNVKLLRISISIDAIDQAFDFIRWPAKWEQISTFINFINQQSFNTIIDITCTVGVHNILEVDKLIAWQKTNLLTNMQGDPVTLNFQMVGELSYGGTVLKLDSASRGLASYILPHLIEIKNYSIWSTIEHSLSNANGNDPWVDYLDELSICRNVNWKDYLPALAESLKISQISGK
jgi:sulfatase maturation enzyme AslB (radical SAM superfamily)